MQPAPPPRTMVLAALAAALALAGCGGGSPAGDVGAAAGQLALATTSTTTTTTSTTTSTTTAPPPPVTTPPPTEPAPPATAAPKAAVQAEPSGTACVVRLHGKGGGGSPTTDAGGVKNVVPAGNAAGWGGRQWLYFPASEYAAARAVVQGAIDAAGCGRVVIDGFSNGGGFAAKLYCRGETFGGRLVGVVVDDPVVDHAVEGCAPAHGVHVALYWSGALAGIARPGWNCAEQDWTCEGGTTIGIDAYQAALRVTRKPSPNTTHAPYDSPPELRAWL